MYDFRADPKLSESWKRRFEIIEKYGMYGRKDPQGFKSLSLFQRSNFNIFAFLFGPFYFLVKGMYRVGLSSFLVLMLLLILLSVIDSIFGTTISNYWTSSASGAVYAIFANGAYYDFKVNEYRGWNPLHYTTQKNL